jgi:predicted negative regulator of RcsB-dependent stress response
MASTSATRERRVSVDPDDAVAMRAAELAAWAQRNVRVILAAAVLALVVVGGYLYYHMYQRQRAASAAAAFMQVQAGMSADTVAAAREMESFIRRYDGSLEADEARLMLGERYLSRNQAAKAAEVLRPAADGGSPLSFQARQLLAASQAQQGQRDQAVRTYLELADEAELDYQKQEALSQAALLREQAGDWKGAAELYRRMIETTEEGSLDRSILELRAAEAEARAGAAPAAGQKQ